MAIKREGGEGLELRLEDIHAGYRRAVLKGVDLAAAPGQLVVILGGNGAGKSSIFKVVAGLLHPDSGRVWLGGEDITSLAAHRRVRRGVSYQMQGGRVFPSLTVEQNLILGAHPAAGAERGDRLEEVFALFPHLRALRGARANLLSGGVRQALALAAKLVSRPRLLLLDEPTVGLRPALAHDLFEHLRRVNRERGTTILVIEKDTPEVLGLAQRVVYIHAGRVAPPPAEPAGAAGGGGRAARAAENSA